MHRSALPITLQVQSGIVPPVPAGVGCIRGLRTRQVAGAPNETTKLRTPALPVRKPRGEWPRPGVGLPHENGRTEDKGLEVLLMLGITVEEEQQRIDLVVVAAIGESEELVLEIGEPEGFGWQEDATGF